MQPEILYPTYVGLDEPSGTILAHLDPQAYGFLDQAVRLGRHVFEPKSELHITITPPAVRQALAEQFASDKSLAADVRAAIQAADWGFTRRPELAHIVKSKAVESIVQRVDMPALEGFYALLRRITGQPLELPPAHVTLYTRGAPRGIGIPTEADFRRMQRAVYPSGSLERP